MHGQEQPARGECGRTPLSAHWSWRLDWTPERRCWWWYATFEHDRAVQRAAGLARSALVRGAPLDVIPSRWLHLSLAELGYAEARSRSAMYASARGAHRALGPMPPVEVVVGPAATMSGAVVLPVTGPALHEIHHILAGAAADLPQGAPVQREFLPHVSVAYLNAECTPEQVLDGEAASRGRAASTRIDRLTLAEVVRDDRHYRWTGRCLLSLGRDRTGPASSAQSACD